TTHRKSTPIDVHGVTRGKEIRMMCRRKALPAAWLACLYSVIVMAPLVSTTERSFPRLDSTILVAQASASSPPPVSAATGGPKSAEELSKELSNPIASLIS